MIMRQLAQVGGICSLKAANLRQLSSLPPIGSTGETAASTSVDRQSTLTASRGRTGTALSHPKPY
jgi:hypothetical protein